MFGISCFHRSFKNAATQMAFYANKHKLFDGDIVLYQRRSPTGKVSPTWQMRLKLEGKTGYVTQSCKTKRYEDAYALAKQQHRKLQHKLESGVPLRDWSFNLHWKDWFDRQVSSGAWNEDRQRWHRQLFNRYFSPYFGNKTLNEITVEFADGYWHWRLDYWKSEDGKKRRNYNPARRNAKTRGTLNFKLVPSRKTLQMEQSALNQIFADAFRQRRIQYPIKLKAPRISRLDTRRPGFDQDEWTVLTRHLHAWSQQKFAYRNDKVNAFHKLHRQQLSAYVVFLASSGLRPGEAKLMRWEDIDEHIERNGGRYLKIRVRANTKQGKARDVIPMPSARGCLSEWFRLSGNPKPQTLVWHGPKKNRLACEDSPPTDLNKTFQNFLRRVPYHGRAEGLLCDADGLRRTLYSLRHTYATFALIDGKLTELELARNMGTGVAQIEHHYSHVKNTQRAAKLSDMKLPGEDLVAMRNAIDEEIFGSIADQIDEEIDRLPG